MRMDKYEILYPYYKKETKSKTKSPTYPHQTKKVNALLSPTRSPSHIKRQARIDRNGGLAGSCPRHRQARSSVRRRPPQLLARVVAPAVQTGKRRASFRSRRRALLHRSLDTCLGMWLASLSAETLKCPGLPPTIVKARGLKQSVWSSAYIYISTTFEVMSLFTNQFPQNIYEIWMEISYLSFPSSFNYLQKVS